MTRVPGRTKKLSAYISELWGLLSVITVIHNMWKYHEIRIHHHGLQHVHKSESLEYWAKKRKDRG